VLDASGNPIPNKTVNWNWTSSPTGGALASAEPTSVTDAHGIAYSRVFQGIQSGTPTLPYLQTFFTASADSASTTFVVSQALLDNFSSSQLVFSQPDWFPNPPPTLTGAAGSVSTTPIKIHVDGRGLPIPNISVRLLNDDPKTLPSATCATDPGADPGAVLTNANGDATCYPVFGSIAGKASLSVLVGGLDPLQWDQTISPQPLTTAVAYDQYKGVQINVTPLTPGRISIVSGNNQSINPGQTSAPLVALVQDATGAVSIANTSVQWTVTPAGAASLSSALTTTNSSGQTQITATLAPNAVGQVSIRAALTGANSAVAATFTISTNVQISSMTKVSGDTQTAPANQNFPNPLTVQLTGTNGQPVVNQPVTFVVTGGSATVSAASANTDGNGRASVTAKAGATPGAVTISAAVGSISQSFSLTVIPPGPSLTTNSFFSVGGTSRISALAPCSLVTVVAAGVAPNIQNLVLNSNSFGPWAGTLGSDTVSVNNAFAPIASVGVVNGAEQITFQVPCDVAVSSSVPVTVNVGGGTGTVNMPVQLANPGILETVMTDSVRRAVAVRPDGTFVSLQNPARRGDVIRVFVTGMGSTIPAVGTGSLPVPGVDALVAGQVIVGINNAGARVVTSRLAPNLIGVAEVAFQVPSDAPTGNDIVLSVAVNAPSDSQTRFSNGSKLPIQ